MINKKIVETGTKYKRYNISFKGNELDLDKFKKGKTKDNEPRLECDVVILYLDELQKLEDENSTLKQENQSIKKNLEDLNHKINEQQEQIETLQETNNKLTSDNVHQTNQELKHQEEIEQLIKQYHQKQASYNNEINKLKEQGVEHQKVIYQLQKQHYETLMQEQREHNKEKNKLKDTLIALRVKDQNKMDTIIAELNDLTLMQRIRRKHFNEILNEMREHKENMLPLPDLEEEAHQL